MRWDKVDKDSVDKMTNGFAHEEVFLRLQSRVYTTVLGHIIYRVIDEV
jgi:hypothetical protein